MLKKLTDKIKTYIADKLLDDAALKRIVSYKYLEQYIIRMTPAEGEVFRDTITAMVIKSMAPEDRFNSNDAGYFLAQFKVAVFMLLLENGYKLHDISDMHDKWLEFEDAMIQQFEAQNIKDLTGLDTVAQFEMAERAFNTLADDDTKH